MIEKQTTRVRKFLRSDATPLSTEAIDEIRNASKNIPNAERVMCKKHRIGASRYKNIINNRIPPEPTEEWRNIINSVRILPSHLGDDESSQNLETASEVSTTLSDVSSEKSITSKKSQRLHQKGKAKIDDSVLPSTLLHMAEKKENRGDDSSMLVPDIEKLVNRCARLVEER
ncbi:unnamed protein product [Rhizophagus irregularis]|uniref:Uncharacterized protein n=1 Tax=Rhizophagus irregularis TaxID=588596 RepID=A0A2I1GMK6_9GLOM|nr:hypothetical protein RhiirA4_421725 [Rhizophagus irregularis]CAB4435831.1 unnamed protein product [Rhizophagus irregularis]